MFRDLDAIKQYADIDPAEEEMLNSWRRPIVILKEKKKLAPGVSEGLKTIGSMLPYMPFHYLLFHKLKTPVMVFTSGNVSDEPIIIDDESALRFLGPVSDAILSYNRQIYNRTDDSVMISVSGSPRIIRRSRGYVPNPVRLGFSVDGILATGAELVNCFCIGKGHNAIISQHIGDLKNYETYAFYKESIDRFSKAFRFKPDLIACDIHPDYLSTRYAMETGIRMTGIQHHHAHIASVLAENNLVEKVIGVSFDGTGLGDDGRIWGGEFLICDLIEYERYTHFRYIPMPGGDAVTYEPWRMAVSYLYNIYGIEFLNFDLDFLKKADRKSVSLVFQMLDRNINCPLTSSCGRLFDAVSALLNICTHSTFHAEAPMRLENEIDHNEQGYYVAEISDTIDFRPVIRMIIRDLQEKIPVSVISARFHNTIVAVVETIAGDIVKKTGLTKIVLSGGVFQNRYLSGKMEQKLRNAGFIVYINRLTPANDGGIALGQLAIAAKRGIPGIL